MSVYSNRSDAPLSLDTMRAAIDEIKKRVGEPITPGLQTVSNDFMREAKEALEKAKRGEDATLPDGSQLFVYDRGRRERRRIARQGVRGRRGSRRVEECPKWCVIPRSEFRSKMFEPATEKPEQAHRWAR